MTHNPSEQLQLDFGAPAADGVAIWQWERQATLDRLSRDYGLPLGQRVRLRRANIDGEFVGKLELASLPTTTDRRQPLQLRLDRMIFSSHEVEYCQQEKQQTSFKH